LSLLHQRYKDFYFLLIAQATWPNYWLKKLRHSGRSVNGHRLDLHLGCGPKYLPGFVELPIYFHSIDQEQANYSRRRQ